MSINLNIILINKQFKGDAMVMDKIQEKPDVSGKEQEVSGKEQMKQEVSEIEANETKCPECGSENIINDQGRGEVACGACGLVIDDSIMDMGPEWRAFDSEQRDKRTRVGAPMTYTIHDKGLSTMIDWRNKDIYGRHPSQKSCTVVQAQKMAEKDQDIRCNRKKSCICTE